ncbi:MAG: hypothetical protein AAGM67_03920, partial [Bacteroidota bacterium]
LSCVVNSVLSVLFIYVNPRRSFLFYLAASMIDCFAERLFCWREIEHLVAARHCLAATHSKRSAKQQYPNETK